MPCDFNVLFRPLLVDTKIAALSGTGAARVRLEDRDLVALTYLRQELIANARALASRIPLCNAA